VMVSAPFNPNLATQGARGIVVRIPKGDLRAMASPNAMSRLRVSPRLAFLRNGSLLSTYL